MSRFIEEWGGKPLITIDCLDLCKHLYNEVCCNPVCPKLADFPNAEVECFEGAGEKRCACFEAEDCLGIDKEEK